ncbi:MAG: class I tRNA ligase family protein, partial [Ruminococcus sp.]|nr:class I tRNA ligase family protein [Ruminococcus sp.]
MALGFKTTYEVLVGITKLMAPIVPFVTDEIYRNLTDEESVHLANYPEYDETKFNNEIEEKMDLVRDLISIGRNVREETKIKVRQPLNNILL